MPEVDLPAVLASRVRAATARAGTGRVVAFDGFSGAGKSTLANAVATELAAPVVLVDDLMPGWDGLPEALVSLREEVLEPLSAGRPGSYRRYDWLAGALADGRVEVPVTPYLVLDGCGSGSRALAPFLSLLVWVTAPYGVRFDRAMARDGDVFRPHWDRWEEQTAALFAREGTAERADVVVERG